MRKVLAVLSALALATALLLVAPLGASADVPSSIADYSTYAYATGVHVIGLSLPLFRTLLGEVGLTVMDLWA